MLKLQRNYYAEFKIIEDKEEKEVITVKYPTSCSLHIETGSYKSANMAVLQFLNLSRQDQAKLWLDIYNIGKKQIYVSVYAGYGNNMPLVFYGWVQLCTSQRESGAVDWVTEVQAYEGGKLFRYGFLNATFTESTKPEDIINYALEQDPNTKIGCITPDLPPLPRNKTFIGQTMDLFGREYGGYEVFIDKGKLHILGDNDVKKGDLLVITDETGLLGSPRRANSYVELEMLFEPQLNIGQAVSLLSDSMPQFNGVYKVIAINHTGTISDTQCGTLKTYLTLFKITGEAREVEEAKPATYDSKTVSGAWAKPVSGKVTDPYGYRIHPIKKKRLLHTGMDIGAGLNTPVYAPANGTVTFVGYQGGYGKAVQLSNGILNGKTLSSLFGHLNSWAVKVGDPVYKSQTIIGYVGSTGNSTGPHLHFEVREDGTPVNPTKYIGNY